MKPYEVNTVNKKKSKSKNNNVNIPSQSGNSNSKKNNKSTSQKSVICNNQSQKSKKPVEKPKGDVEGKIHLQSKTHVLLQTPPNKKSITNKIKKDGNLKLLNEERNNLDKGDEISNDSIIDSDDSEDIITKFSKGIRKPSQKEREMSTL